MKAFFITSVMLLMISNLSLAEVGQYNSLNASLKSQQIVKPIQQNNSCKYFPNTELAKRGCCSRHKGVCGCTNNGRTKCCDGTISPTCTCNGLTDQAVSL